LNYLAKDALAGWKKEFPNLEHLLETFCKGFTGPTELLKQKKMDRRSLKRVKISGIGQVNILNKSGVPMAKSAACPLRLELPRKKRPGYCWAAE
jgi:hypothetical protein